MYLDRHDILKLKKELEEEAVFEDNICLIYRDKEGELNVAFGEEEIDEVSSD